ncbi:MAG: hypothetical protein WD359_03930, partial [Dehalococcoidia bacterium]
LFALRALQARGRRVPVTVFFTPLEEVDCAPYCERMKAEMQASAAVLDFEPAWPGGAVTGGANIAYAFNSDPATCSFLTHIASAEAQQVWVELGGFTSLNSGVDIDAYPDEVAQHVAEQLLESETFRFDQDDAIGGAGQQAIFAGVIQYLTDPASLDSILESVEAARQ